MCFLTSIKLSFVPPSSSRIVWKADRTPRFTLSPQGSPSSSSVQRAATLPFSKAKRRSSDSSEGIARGGEDEEEERSEMLTSSSCVERD